MSVDAAVICELPPSTSAAGELDSTRSWWPSALIWLPPVTFSPGLAVGSTVTRTRSAAALLAEIARHRATTPTVRLRKVMATTSIRGGQRGSQENFRGPLCLESRPRRLQGGNGNGTDVMPPVVGFQGRAPGSR